MKRCEHETIEGFHRSNVFDHRNNVPLLDRLRSSSALWSAEEDTASPRTPKQWHSETLSWSLKSVPLLDRLQSSSALWPAEEDTASPRTPKQWHSETLSWSLTWR